MGVCACVHEYENVKIKSQGSLKTDATTKRSFEKYNIEHDAIFSVFFVVTFPFSKMPVIFASLDIWKSYRQRKGNTPQVEIKKKTTQKYVTAHVFRILNTESTLRKCTIFPGSPCHLTQKVYYVTFKFNQFKMNILFVMAVCFCFHTIYVYFIITTSILLHSSNTVLCFALCRRYYSTLFSLTASCQKRLHTHTQKKYTYFLQYYMYSNNNE